MEQVLNKSNNDIKRFSKSTREDVAQKYCGLWRWASTELRENIEDSREGWDFYLRNHPNNQQPAATKGAKRDSADVKKAKGLRLGLIPRAIDSVKSIISNNLFPDSERWFYGTPRNDFTLENQERYEAFRQLNFADQAAVSRLKQALLSSLIDPAVCVGINWNQRKRRRVFYEPDVIDFFGLELQIPGAGLKKRTNENWIEWEGSEVEVLDFNDWRVDPYAKCMEETWFQRRWYEPIWKVKKDFGLKNVEPYWKAWGFEEEYESNNKRESSGLDESAPIPFAEEDEGKKQCLLQIVYDDIIVDGKVYENHVALILNGKEMIWFGENPYDHGRVPYLVAAVLPIPNQIYGMSLIKHAIPSASVVDSAVSKIMKIAAWAADPVFEVDMLEPKLKGNTRIKPGMKIPVKRPGGAIRQVPINIVNLSVLFQIIEKAEDNIREVTGASPLFTGEDFSNSPANITAFQVDQHVQGASSRFQEIMNNFSSNILEPALEIAFANDRQFKEKDEYVPIGEEEVILTPDDVKQMEFKWVATSAQAALARGKRVANLTAMLQQFFPYLLESGMAQTPGYQLEVDPFNAMQELMTLGGTPNGNKFIRKVPIEEMPLDEGLAPGVGGFGEEPPTPANDPNLAGLL